MGGGYRGQMGIGDGVTVEGRAREGNNEENRERAPVIEDLWSGRKVEEEGGWTIGVGNRWT